MPLNFQPLTADRWDDLVDLFGPERGACGGCWCMWPRVRSVEFKAMTKTERRDAFKALVDAGPPPGLLAYDGPVAAGWVAISPRRAVHRFNITKASTPADERSADLDRTWAITCFYVRTTYRKQGMTQALAEGALRYARKNKARCVEVCAIEPDKPLSWGEGFVGVASALRPLGFIEVARQSPKRPLLRLDLTR
jgi:predicted GNAT family acetyltransferase